MRQVQLIKKLFKPVAKVLRRPQASPAQSAARKSKVLGSRKCHLSLNYTQNRTPTLNQINQVMIYGRKGKVVVNEVVLK